MRDYTLCPTYLIIVKYYNGKWKTISSKYNGYDLHEAIKRCKQELDYEFTYQWGKIDMIYKETATSWEEVDW